MLISKEVEVGLAPPVIKYYEDLGYKIPRKPNRDGVMTVPRGTKIIVNAEHLPVSSDIKIKVQCDYCGKVIDKQYKKYFKTKEDEFCNKDACNDCSSLKASDVLLSKYGVTSIYYIEGVKDKIIKSRRKYNIYDIKNEFQSRGFILLSESYVNTDEKLDYICLKHKDRGIQSITYGNFLAGKGCWDCGNEKISDALRFDYDYVKEIFINKNCTLISKEYINCKLPIEFICNNHSDIIQTTTLDNFNVVGCVYCNKENRILESEYSQELQTYTYLRTAIREWKQNSIKSSNYQCVITGEQFDDVHHLYSFKAILDETLIDLKMQYQQMLSDYTKEDLVEIINLLQSKHIKYGDGVCLKRNIHELFHNNFQYQNNTPEQFEEFKTRLKQGEFNDFLEQNNLKLII